LFLNLLPDRIYAFKGESCHGHKRSKDRITVLVCANMDGPEKMPILETFLGDPGVTSPSEPENIGEITGLTFGNDFLSCWHFIHIYITSKLKHCINHHLKV
jgi:hypothetical protein